MTELESAACAIERQAEIEKEIVKLKEFQNAAISAKDNILTKIWADKIRELKMESSRLDASTRYMKFSVFANVVKTVLTREVYNDCWNRVDEIILRRENVL